jgi:hypothetical protein
MNVVETNSHQFKLHWYQYRLRTLLAVITLFAVWCSFAKWIGPGVVAAITALYGISAGIFLPFYFGGRWFIRNGNWLTGLSYIASAALMAFPYVVFVSVQMIATVFFGPESGDGSPDLFFVVLFLNGCGAVGLFVCFCASVWYLARHEEQSNNESAKGT